MRADRLVLILFFLEGFWPAGMRKPAPAPDSSVFDIGTTGNLKESSDVLSFCFLRGRAWTDLDAGESDLLFILSTVWKCREVRKRAPEDSVRFVAEGVLSTLMFFLLFPFSSFFR